MSKAPEDCRDMSEVRVGVDSTDEALIALLETRFGYMRAASRIKAERGMVRDEARKAAVIDAARRLAEERGLPADLIAELWESLVEGSIAYELSHWDEGHS